MIKNTNLEKIMRLLFR